MAQHVRDVMHRPTALQQSRAAFVTKIVEVQINCPIRSF
jgi:hypothetical protein